MKLSGASALTAFALGSHAVEASELRKLADQYNTTLYRDLSSGTPAKPKVNVGVTPFAAAGGGGLLLTATF